ncbi:uncharacterized protein LOC112016496 isoform X2 [Quercus suber]|uniref:uncharacterized protein LOC112016496 isoform X2 n=1 Tax=Quercus suber TaxID=58331 RepID=UPI000CE27F0F|nr:uncharacterized protein LOC112016496 isoform X1 [Quercus suber]
MQSEPFPVERQILGSNPSLIRGGTTSYSFWNHHWDVKRQQERGARKKIANTEGAGYERLQLNFEINKEDRRVFLDVAPMKYLQPTIQMLSGNTSLGKSNLQLYWLWYKILNRRGNSHQAKNIKTFFCI